MIEIAQLRRLVGIAREGHLERDLRERVGEVRGLRQRVRRVRAAHERDANLTRAHALDGGEHLIGASRCRRTPVMRLRRLDRDADRAGRLIDRRDGERDVERVVAAHAGERRAPASLPPSSATSAGSAPRRRRRCPSPPDRRCPSRRARWRSPTHCPACTRSTRRRSDR